MIYGWTKEYIISNLTLKQIMLYFNNGYNYEMKKHGFTFEENFDSIAEKYYTPEELKERDKYLSKQYGDVE